MTHEKGSTAQWNEPEKKLLTESQDESRTANFKPFQFILLGAPATKKNGQIKVRYGLIQSKRYRDYETDCLWQIRALNPVLTTLNLNTPVNVQIHVYLAANRRSDLVGYLQSLSDILVKGGILEDDNHHIIKSYDGSRVFIDRQNPRAEITITPYEIS